MAIRGVTRVRRPGKLGLAVWIVVAGLWGAVPAGAADGPSDADKAILQNYTLTIEKLRHFGAAEKALYGDAAKDPALKAEIERMADEDPQTTLADLEAKLKRHPRVAAYYKREGLSIQEAIVIPLATLEAMGPGPATPEQLAFVRQYATEIQTLLGEWLKQDGDD
jgi:hypothetical protein